MGQTAKLIVALLMFGAALAVVVWQRSDDLAGTEPEDLPGEAADYIQEAGYPRPGKMLNWKPGQHVHGLLAARFSPADSKGLDIFLVAASAGHRPLPVPMDSMTAMVRTPHGEMKNLTFVRAAANLRPAEGTDACSHFTAEVPWLQPAEMLYVVTQVRLGGSDVKLVWKEFTAASYAGTK